MYILQTYVMIPSNLAYFVLGIVATIAVEIVIGIILSNKKKREAEKVTKDLLEALRQARNDEDK